MNDLEILFKSNTLIKAKYDFTVAQNRVLQKVFYEIQMNKVNIALIPLEDMKQLIRNKAINSVESIKEFLGNLQDNKVMQIKENGSWAVSSVISYYSYDSSKHSFKIEVSLGLLELIHEYTKTGFTPTNVTKYISLGATNAQRFYELLRMWTGTKNVIEYTIEEIKEYLLLQNKYKVFKDFRKWVIEAAIKELKEKELLDIYKVEYIKTGRKVTSIKFYVKDLEPRTYKFKEITPFSTPKKTKKKVSTFANFTQREYDYEKLEKQLLGWDDSDDENDD